MNYVKFSQKTAALSKLFSYLNNSKKKIVCNSKTKSQFSYCSLVWMVCSIALNNMINELEKRLLRIMLNNYSSDLLENNNHIYKHHRNIQALLIEVVNMKNELAPAIMKSILNKRFNTYNLRNFQEFETEKKNRLVWSWNPQLPLSSTLVSSARKPPRNE